MTNDWSKQGAQNVLLQTIYGTAQDANGTIVYPDAIHAVQSYKGKALAFAVPEDTALDKAIFKVVNPSAGKTVQVRFYNVTGKGYLNTGTTVSRANPGGGGTLIFTKTTSIPSPAPSHPEGTRSAGDMVINFGPMEVAAGEYLLVFDCLNEGTNLTTAYSAVRGITATAIDIMGEYGNGAALPKRADGFCLRQSGK